MISARYVLAAADFKPTRAVDRSAALDVRAYLPESMVDSEHHSRFVDGLDKQIFNFRTKYPDGRVFGNGKELKLSSVYRDNYVDFLSQLVDLDDRLRLVCLAPGEFQIINAGFKVGLSSSDPDKIATMFVCSRSGLACKHGICAINAPGIVDEGYPDWVGVGLINHGTDLHFFAHGARIAQVMYVESCLAIESVVDTLGVAGPRTGGFGHTGVA